MKIRKILLRILFLLLMIVFIGIQKEEVNAQTQTAKKVISVDTYDEFWKQFYRLIEDGNPEFTLDIAGKEAQKVKKVIDDHEENPFDHEYKLISKYVSSWKYFYFSRYLALQPYYKLRLQSPGERCKTLDWYVNGLYDIKRIDKDLYFRWGREYYLHNDKFDRWNIYYFSGDQQYYLWDEELQTLQVTVGYKGQDNIYAAEELITTNKRRYAKMAKTFSKVEQLIKSWNLEKLTDYQRISKVNTFICDTVTYDSNVEEQGQSGADALFSGKAVCAGYAELTDIFLSTMGYEAVNIFAFNPWPGHEWNIVKFNGKWYAIDVTWNDDYKGRTRYLLVSQKEMKDHNVFSEGNVGDYTLATTRFSQNSKSKITLAYNNIKKTVKPLELKNNYIIVSKGDEKTLSVSRNTTGKKAVFKSSDPSIATVSSQGVIKGIKRGRAIITVTAGKKTEKCTVMVSDSTLKCYQILFGDDDLCYYDEIGFQKIDQKHAYCMNSALIPAYTTDKIVSYQSSNEAIVTVDKKGLITGHKEGTAYITITTSDGIQGRCEVKVTDKDYVEVIEDEDDWW